MVAGTLFVPVEKVPGSNLSRNSFSPCRQTHGSWLGEAKSKLQILSATFKMAMHGF
jgi:hypothetical protein